MKEKDYMKGIGAGSGDRMPGGGSSSKITIAGKEAKGL